ncbi:MAG: hypothetical protein ACREKN_09340 [Longimicrobiaceae bacterium]
MSPARAPLLAALALLPVLSVCQAASPTETREIGVIEYHGSSEEVILAPDTVRAGVPFEVTVRTYGVGCDRADAADTELIGGTAAIFPYDLTLSSPNLTCPGEIRRLARSVLIRFASPGVAVLRVRGRKVPSENDGSFTTIERTIRVE